MSTPNGPRPAEIKDVEEPVPAPNELIIEVKAASLNRGELRLLPARPGWRPGQDVAGLVVQAASDGTGPPPGARVVAVVDQAGWAERVNAPTNRAAALPDGVSFSAAATLGIAGLTALRALRAAGAVIGRRVLVTGASGGVGRFAVQLAALAGADVTAVAATPDRSRGLRDLGASRIVHEGGELGGPFELVLEAVGGPSLRRSVRALAPGGVLVLCGGAAGEDGRVSLGDFSGIARIQSFFIYQTGVETFGRDVSYLVGLLEQGKLRSQIGLEVSWRDLGKAMEALRERRVNGKVVLTID